MRAIGPRLTPVEATPQCSRADARRFLHDDEARLLQVLDKPLRDDPRHEFAGAVLALAVVEAEGER